MFSMSTEEEKMKISDPNSNLHFDVDNSSAGGL